MTKEKFIETVKEILNKSKMEEFISFSENVNELADIMIYKNDDEYLAIDGKPLFPFGEIQTILYKYGRDKFYNYAGTELQLIIELYGENKYIIEFGDNGILEMMYFDGEWVSEDEKEKISETLMKYNQKIKKRDNVNCLVYSIERLIEEKEDIEDSVLQEVKKEVSRYIKENPLDKEFLLSYAERYLHLYVYEDLDLDIKNTVRKIVKDGYSDELVDYIRQTSAWVYEGYYLTLVTGALRLIQEIKEEMGK